MKLLYKELMLAAHPTSLVFACLGCLVVVPAYPYTVIFMFGCLAPYITFLYARETNDAWYSAILPITKRESVKGKCSVDRFHPAVPAAALYPMRCIADNSPYRKQSGWN
ncbi:ABC-2 transporter permease [Merdimonas faecis]|uniref:ABC-2 transporter permease n=1 Tax=Merdimonas faecis TaxID=1653435 RepID=UPI003FA5AA58